MSADEDISKAPARHYAVSLSLEEWDDVIGGIWGRHSEFCVTSDNCGCGALSRRIESQLPRVEDTSLDVCPG